MGVSIEPEISRKLTKQRKKLLLSQFELSQKAKVSLRTIQDIEGGRRKAFSEATLLAVCRALEIPYDYLWVSDDENGSDNHISSTESVHSTTRGRNLIDILRKKFTFVIVAIILLTTITITTLLVINSNILSNKTKRFDWVTLSSKMVIDPITPEWTEWPNKIYNKECFACINHIEYSRTTSAKDTIPMSIQWSWFYPPPANTEVFISAYSCWEPDSEIRIWHGDLTKEGTKTIPFMLFAPEVPGIYTIRIFYTEAFAPVSNYYGSPPPNQVTAPSYSRYCELVLEVL